jgi:hypothetical protein
MMVRKGLPASMGERVTKRHVGGRRDERRTWVDHDFHVDTSARCRLMLIALIHLPSDVAL